jgi:hypothetical protein
MVMLAIFFLAGWTIQRSPSSASHVSREGKKSTCTSARPAWVAASRMYFVSKKAS